MRAQVWAVLALLALLGVSQLAFAEDRLLSSQSMKSLLDGAEDGAEFAVNEEAPDSVPSILRRELLQATSGLDTTTGTYGGTTAPITVDTTPTPSPTTLPVTLAPPANVQQQTAGAAGVTVGAVTLLVAAAAAILM